MWNPVNLLKLAIETPRNLGTIVRHITLFKEEDGVLTIDGDITGYFCGFCGQGVDWKHFHSKRGG